MSTTEPCPDGQHDFHHRQGPDRKLYLHCIKCGFDKDDPSPEAKAVTPKPAGPVSETETQALRDATGQPLDRVVDVHLTKSQSHMLMALLGAAWVSEECKEIIGDELPGLAVEVARAVEEANKPLSMPAVIQDPAPILAKFNSLEAIRRTQQRHYEDMVVMIKALLRKCERLEAERIAIQNDDKLLTCVFCGHQYPPGTPQSNHESLKAHVATCPDHPAKVFRDLLVEAQQVLQFAATVSPVTSTKILAKIEKALL